jgi:hypothetical protein
MAPCRFLAKWKGGSLNAVILQELERFRFEQISSLTHGVLNQGMTGASVGRPEGD